MVGCSTVLQLENILRRGTNTTFVQVNGTGVWSGYERDVSSDWAFTQLTLLMRHIIDVVHAYNKQEGGYGGGDSRLPPPPQEVGLHLLIKQIIFHVTSIDLYVLYPHAPTQNTSRVWNAGTCICWCLVHGQCHNDSGAAFSIDFATILFHERAMSKESCSIYY